MAVEISNGHLSFGRGKSSVTTLNGINLRVTAGQIYGLIGPSGCGKTTLLNCVIGKTSLSSGKVRVFGQKPGSIGCSIPGRNVGYMPQEIALYPEFTINETLAYFGKIHLVDNDVLKSRKSFYLDLMDLSFKDRVVKKLSGGQRRRVSLVIAMLHHPPLLILDEPTVGVDPLLRQNIWDYLVKLTTSEGITVIVTTHYIEEARQANVVGFMRMGRILAENSPRQLMRMYKTTTLEECFVNLCKLDTKSIEDEVFLKSHDYLNNNGRRKSLSTFYESYPMEIKTIDDTKKSVKETSGNNLANQETRDSFPKQPNPFYDYFWKLLTLMWKNVIRIRRNKPLLLFQLAIPSIQLVLLCLCIGSPPFHIPIAVVNDELPAASGYQLLKAIDSATVIQVPLPDVKTAVQSVLDGHNWGMIYIPRNFSACLMMRMTSGLQIHDGFIDCGTIHLRMDLTSQTITLTVHHAVITAFMDFSKKILSSLGSSTRITDLPVVMGEPIYGEPKVGYLEFIAPAVVVSITYIMAVGLTALSFVEERKSGLYDRNWVSGVTVTQILTSYVFVQFIVISLQVFGLFICTFWVFGITVKGSFVWVYLLCLLQGVCGMSYGLLISTLVREEGTAIMLSLGSFYPNLIMSGVVWPLEGMPFYMRYITYCMPQTIAIESVRNILGRGWGIEQNIVWLAFVVSAIWILFFLTTAVIVMKLKSK